MKSKLLQDGNEKTFALIFDEGDEVMEGLTSFAKEQGLTAGRINAIGGFQDVELGYFDWAKKDYKHIPVKEQVEVLSLIGDIAEQNGEPKVHMHVVLGKADGTTVGGHIFRGHVRPTLEVIINEPPAHLRRKSDERTGLALISL